MRRQPPAASNSTSTQPLDAIGLCVPGIVDGETGTIRTAINVPSLVGVDPAWMVREAIGLDDINVERFTDAHAAAHDLWDGHAHQTHQDHRMAAISIGTGVGLCVLDKGVPLEIGFGTPGHLGQIDVSLDSTDAPVGPDGGRGGLEAYIGWPALRARYERDGQGVENLAACLVADDVPLRALARAIRIVHAIYRPNRVVLLGGVGIAIRPCLTHLHSLIAEQLTSLAREGWTLETGDSLHHAASGAARLAARRMVEYKSRC